MRGFISRVYGENSPDVNSGLMHLGVNSAKDTLILDDNSGWTLRWDFIPNGFTCLLLVCMSKPDSDEYAEPLCTDAFVHERLPNDSHIPSYCRWIMGLSLAAVACAVAWIIWGTVSGLLSIHTLLPLYDSWSVVADLRSFEWCLGKGMRYLLDEYNEHRIVLTRLVMMIDYTFFGGRKVLPVVLIHLLNLCSFVMVAWLIRGRKGSAIPEITRVLWAGVPFLCVMQVKNFDSVFQIQFFWVSVFSMASIMATSVWMRGRSSGDVSGRWLIFGLGLAFLGSFSMANGLVIWPVLIMWLLIRKAGIRWVSLVAGCAVLCFVMYFNEFGSLGKQHAIPLSLDLIPKGFAYLCYFVANLLCDKGSACDWFEWVGAAGWLMALWLAVSAFMAQKRTAAQEAVPWIVMFLLGTVGMAFLGRLHDGDVMQGINGRYTTVSAWFWAVTTGCWMAPWNKVFAVRHQWFSVTLRYGPPLLVLVLLLIRQSDLIRDLREMGELRRRSDLVMLSGTADRNWLNAISAGLRWRDVELLRARGLSYYGTDAYLALGSRVELSDYPETLESAVVPKRVVVLPFKDESWFGMRVEGCGSGIVSGRLYRVVNEAGVLAGYLAGRSSPSPEGKTEGVDVDAALRCGLGYVVHRDRLWVIREHDRVPFDFGSSEATIDGWVIGMTAPGRFRPWTDYRIETGWGQGCDPASGARGFGGPVWSSWPCKSAGEGRLNGGVSVRLDFHSYDAPTGYVGIPIYIKGSSEGMEVMVESMEKTGRFPVDLSGLEPDRWHFLVVNYPSMPSRLRVFVDDHSGDPGRWIAVHEPMILPLECVR